MNTNTIADILGEMAAQICDHYCKWPDVYEDDEEKMCQERCSDCPLNILGI